MFQSMVSASQMELFSGSVKRFIYLFDHIQITGYSLQNDVFEGAFDTIKSIKCK